MKAVTIFACIVCLLFVVSCGQKKENVLKVGDRAPDFQMTDMQGTLVSLAALGNRPVVLRFFTPDCKYCKADTVSFSRFYQQYEEKGLLVVYLDVEPEPKEIESFVRELDIKFPVLLDSHKEIADLYHVKVVPQTIVLDPEHTIIAAILGGVSFEELEELLGGFLH